MSKRLTESQLECLADPDHPLYGAEAVAEIRDLRAALDKANFYVSDLVAQLINIKKEKVGLREALEELETAAYPCINAAETDDEKRLDEVWKKAQTALQELNDKPAKVEREDDPPPPIDDLAGQVFDCALMHCRRIAAVTPEDLRYDVAQGIRAMAVAEIANIIAAEPAGELERVRGTMASVEKMLRDGSSHRTDEELCHDAANILKDACEQGREESDEIA